MKSAVKAVVETVAPRLLYRYQLYQEHRREPEIDLLPKLCRIDAISVDIGANKGLYSLYMLRRSAGVIAFEPLPEMCERLSRHFGNRVLIHPVALSDRVGECELRRPRGSTAWATIEPRNTLGLAGDAELLVETVPVRRLDDYQLEGVGLIKIDVEGHEEAVLRGGIETIRRSAPNLMVEIEERHNEGAVGRVSSFLERLGYAGYFVDGQEMKPIQDFCSERDQPIRNVAASGKLGRYVNNFIFLPKPTE